MSVSKGSGKGIAALAVVALAGVLALLLAVVVAVSLLVSSVLGGGDQPEGATCIAAGGETGGIPEQWREDVEKAAAVSGLPVAVHAAMTEKESGWNESAVNTDSGAAGMAQFMPETWAIYGDGDPMDGSAALAAQGRYMAALTSLAADQGKEGEEQVRTALAAYNWGPGNLERAGWDWRRGPDETIDYVTVILERSQVDYSDGCVAEAYDGDLGDGEWAHPLPGSQLTGGGAFGLRNVPGLPAWAQNHVGLDFATEDGGKVVAPFDAVVTSIYAPDGCVMARGIGETKHGFAVCHLDAWGVAEGQELSLGDVIGDEGTRAASVGVGVIRHLHFEMYEPGEDPQFPGPDAPGVIDPTPLLREKGVI